ncbi:reverse transcriptase domain-containing protein [Tanacetum coccineum]
MQEPSESGIRVRVPPPQIDPKDEGKAKMVEPEKPKKKKDQIEYDADDDVQAMMDADYELAAKLQAEEQGEISIEERSKLFVELINERKKHFARLKAEEQRRKPPTKTQKRNLIVNIFVDMDAELVKGSETMESEVNRTVPKLAAGSTKRVTEEELDQESSKRQQTGESSELAEEPRDKEAEELSQEELQQMMIIVPEPGINVEALQTKDDLVMLWSLVKEKFNSTKPTDDKEREIWVELKRLFEPDTDDKEGNRHLHAGRKGVSIVKRNSYIDAGRKALGEDYWELKFSILSTAKPRVSTAQVTTASTNQLVLLDEDEEEECTPELKSQTSKLVKDTPVPKPYKLKILYPQRLRKEKMEAQYVGMPNYGKFLKELRSNKHKLEQISSAFLSDESFAMIQNKVPPKLRDPRSFLIPCTFSKAFSCNALADLGASINLISYSLYAKLSLETLNPTKMSIRLADRSFQHPIGIIENMLVEVGKFTFHVDFVILEMEEDSKVPLILGRPFLHTTDAVIRVRQKQLNRKTGTERMTFSIDSMMKHSYSNNDTCFRIDVIDTILEEDFDTLLDEGSEILHSIEGTILEEKLFAEFDEFMAMNIEENSESKYETEEPPLKNHL